MWQQCCHDVVMTTNQPTKPTYPLNAYQDLDDLVRDTLMETAFLPLEHGDLSEYADSELALTDRDISVLDYFGERHYDAFRLEPAGTTTWATLARWSDEGIDLLSIDRNGVELASARLSFSPAGAAWLAALLHAA